MTPNTPEPVRRMVEQVLSPYKQTPRVRKDFCQFCDDVVLKDEICDCDVESTRQDQIAEIEEALTTHATTLYNDAVREEREACAVTVWNYLATFTDNLEPTERTNALNDAIKLIRERGTTQPQLPNPKNITEPPSVNLTNEQPHRT